MPQVPSVLYGLGSMAIFFGFLIATDFNISNPWWSLFEADDQGFQALTGVIGLSKLD
jgi:hypothetical protein